jgi:hypothetical protein
LGVVHEVEEFAAKLHSRAQSLSLIVRRAKRICCASDQFLSGGVPAHGTALAITIHGHAARDGDAMAA